MNQPTMCPPCKVAQPRASYLPQAPGPDASILLARNLMLSELPGLAFSLITLVYVVASLIGLM